MKFGIAGVHKKKGRQAGVSFEQIYSVQTTPHLLVQIKFCPMRNFRRKHNEIFNLLGCSAALIGSFRRFGKTY